MAQAQKPFVHNYLAEYSEEIGETSDSDELSVRQRNRRNQRLRGRR
jgi:hypothetical protein